MRVISRTPCRRFECVGARQGSADLWSVRAEQYQLAPF